MADQRDPRLSDPRLSQHYRSLEPLEPPRELDQAILAAARRAADQPHAPLVAPAGRHRWYYSLAAAAVLVFAVALTLHIERERPDQEAAEPAPARAPELRLERELRGQIKPAPEAQVPAVREREPEPTFTPEPPASPPPQESRAAAEANRDQASAQPSAPAPLAKPAPSPAPAARAMRSDGSRDRLEAARAEQAAKQAQAEPQARARRESGVAAQQYAAPAAAPVPPENPERWLERIAELRSRGKHEEADKQLAEFRRVYPDYKLSEVMRERVEGK